MSSPWYQGWMGGAMPSYAPYAPYWTLPGPHRGGPYPHPPAQDPSTLPRPGGRRVSEFAVSDVNQHYEMETKGYPHRGKRSSGYYNDGFEEDHSKMWLRRGRCDWLIKILSYCTFLMLLLHFFDYFSTFFLRSLLLCKSVCESLRCRVKYLQAGKCIFIYVCVCRWKYKLITIFRRVIAIAKAYPFYKYLGKYSVFLIHTQVWIENTLWLCDILPH